MFRYFYRIWDKFRYKHKDQSEIVATTIYTYKGELGKDKRYVYKLPELESDIQEMFMPIRNIQWQVNTIHYASSFYNLNEPIMAPLL